MIAGVVHGASLVLLPSFPPFYLPDYYSCVTPSLFSLAAARPALRRTPWRTADGRERVVSVIKVTDSAKRRQYHVAKSQEFGLSDSGS